MNFIHFACCLLLASANLEAANFGGPEGARNGVPGGEGAGLIYGGGTADGPRVEELAADDEAIDVSTDPYAYESHELPTNPKYFPSVGNGHLAHTVYRDRVFVNGIYNGALGYSHRARVPAMHASNFSVESDGTNCTVITSRSYRLDLENGTLTETIRLPSVTFTYRVYAHQFYNRLLVTEVLLERNAVCDECCNANVTILREDIGSEPSVEFDMGPRSVYNATGCDGGCRSENGTIKEKEEDRAPLTNVTYYWHEMPLTFTSIHSETDVQHHHFVLSVDQSYAVAQANFDAALDIIGSANPSELLDNHTAAFREIWARGTIDVRGDLHLDKVLHGSLYYLYTSLPAHPTFSPNNQFYALSPGGLPNGANATDYQGHVFWDMETWMYPSILMFRPDLARDMLSYRIAGMDLARERAVEGGYSGVRFPWECAFTGVEVTPDICVPCRENQQHITGDIAYAARQYVSATRDVTWLNATQAGTPHRGIDFITQMADFWRTRPTLNATTQRYDIKGVMPPDEHQESVDNSVYTNVAASYAIHFARFAHCLLGNNTAIPDSWIQVAQNLKFPFQREHRYHEEYDGYDNERQTNTTDPRGIKQADVVMLGFPFLWEMPDDVRANDLTWYETVTHPNGPAMTWGIHAIGWLDLKNYTKAEEMFRRAYLSYTREPFNIWTEVQSGDGAVNFITGMGGFLQAVLFGYGGLRLDVDELRFHRAELPTGVTQMTFRHIAYLGAEFDLQVDTLGVTVTIWTIGEHELVLIEDAGQNRPMIPGGVISIPRSAFTIRAVDRPNCKIAKPEINVDYSGPAKDSKASRDQAAITALILATSAIAIFIGC